MTKTTKHEELAWPERKKMIDEDINKNLKILSYEPEGQLVRVDLRQEPALLPEVVSSYRAIFGDTPWGVLKDKDGNIITWVEAKEKLNNAEHVTHDEAYTPEAIERLLINWIEIERSHITVEKDVRGRVFSLLAWFEYDSIDDVVEQIEKDNYKGNVSWVTKIKPELTRVLKKNAHGGKLLYVADMAKLPSIRKNLWHTMSFWLNLVQLIVVEYYGEEPNKEGLTSIFRASAQEGAPLSKQIKNIFKIDEPVYREAGESVYYIIQGESFHLQNIIEAVRGERYNEAFMMMMMLTGGLSQKEK